MFQETTTRSVLKAISWRLLATLTTILLVYLFTGRIGMAFTLGGIEIILKMLLYYLHERAWNRTSFGRKEPRPVVLWFTGLSGAGKSTISEKVYARLKEQGVKVEHLDGDRVREIFPKTGFSKEERNRHVKRVGFLASMLEKNGVTVLASFISPYRESREFVRNLCDNFVEVYVATPLEVCEQRDIKGLYAKARKGEITQFTGIDDPYEAPEKAEIVVDTSNQTVDESVNYVLRELEKYQK
jgi:adenylylsulfate kinase